MRKPPRALVLTVAVPFMTACMGTLPQPLPEPSARATTELHGVVLGPPADGQQVAYDEILDVQWTDSTLVMIGAETGARGAITTRTYRLADVSAVLVRQLDPNRTSIFIGGLFVGAAIVGMLLFTGKTTDNTRF